MEPILFIAPSQAIATLAAKVCAELHLAMPIHVATLAQAQELVRANPQAHAIISRGGMAAELRKSCSQRVIGITSTMTDVLAPVHRLACAGARRIAIVVNGNTLDDAAQTCQVGDLEIQVRPWWETREIIPAVQALARAGVQGIVGDRTGLEAAKACGLLGEPLDSGPAGLQRAIREAVQVARAREVEVAAEGVKVQIRLCAQEITLALETAGLAIQKLNASSREIAGTVQNSAGIGKKLHVEVDQSAEILHLIRQLGNRTNVLGLNASIEAANAGALGRGFGVVAKEIKALADETGQSVGSIFKMLENIRGSAGQVLGNVELTREFTEAQARSTNDLAAMMEGVKVIGRRLMALQS